MPLPFPAGSLARLWTAGSAVALVCALAAGCQHVNPYYDAKKPHHRPDGFQNRYTEFTPRGMGDLVRWRWNAWREGLPKPPQALPPVVSADLPFLRANAAAGSAMQPAVTFIGHATALLQIPLGDHSLQVLTDPVFSDRASPFSFVGPRRLQPPGVALADLPHIDVVLISHNHYDHLDEASVRALAAQPGGAPLFIAPLGIASWLASHGVPSAIELDWWESHRVERGGAIAEITLTPAQHWSGRGLGDRLATLWGGFALLAPDFHFFYSGDTGYSRDFADIGAHFAARQDAAHGGGFDLALLPVGAYEPRWFMREQHVNPAESVRIHREIGAKRSVGVHWGTFALTDEPFDQPPRDLAEACRAQGVPAADFSTIAIGETRRLVRRTPSLPG